MVTSGEQLATRLWHVQSKHPMIGSWAANRVAVLRKGVDASDMSPEQWGDALDFGLHNFNDVGASVQDMLMAGDRRPDRHVWVAVLSCASCGLHCTGDRACNLLVIASF